MNQHFFKAVLLSLTLVFATVGHVDAARLGGGKSIGRAPSAPMQKQAAPVQKPAQQAQPAAPAPAPRRALQLLRHAHFGRHCRLQAGHFHPGRLGPRHQAGLFHAKNAENSPSSARVQELLR